MLGGVNGTAGGGCAVVGDGTDCDGAGCSDKAGCGMAGAAADAAEDLDERVGIAAGVAMAPSLASKRAIRRLGDEVFSGVDVVIASG